MWVKNTVARKRFLLAISDLKGRKFEHDPFKTFTSTTCTKCEGIPWIKGSFQDYPGLIKFLLVIRIAKPAQS